MENKYSTIWFVMSIIALTIGVVIMIFWLTLNILADTQCKELCEDKGTIFYDRISSGNWRLDDWCLCIAKERIQIFRLGEGN